MAEILNLQEVAALGFVSDLPEDASVHRKRVREARLRVRAIRRQFETERAGVNAGGMLSEFGVADALKSLAEGKLSELAQIRTLADQTEAVMTKALAGPAPTDSVTREVRELKRRMLLYQLLELDQKTRFEMFFEPDRLDFETLQAVAEAPPWLRRRVAHEEVLAQIEEAVVVKRDPERGIDWRATKGELARLRSEVEIIEKPMRELTGGDAIKAMAAGA